MEMAPPLQTFEVGSCWPLWDNSRSARLAWAEHAQRKGFLVKESTHLHNIVLSCATCSRSSSPSCAVQIAYDSSQCAEKVVAVLLKHNHPLLPLSPSEISVQEGMIYQRRANLLGYALNELKSIERCGGLANIPPPDRKAAQDGVVADVKRALGDESADALLNSAQKLRFLIGSGTEREPRSTAPSLRLRPRPPRTSRLLPASPSSSSSAPSTVSTPLPSSLCTFRTVNQFDTYINAWAQEQGFSVRSESAGEESGLRYCSAKTTAAKCGWFIDVDVKSTGQVVVMEQYASHSHALGKGASSAILMGTPRAMEQGRQRERSNRVEPELGVKTDVGQDLVLPLVSEPRAPAQLRSPSLSPPHPMKRERDPTPALPVIQPSESSLPSANASAKRRRRDTSSPLLVLSPRASARSSSTQAQLHSTDHNSASPLPRTFSANDSLQDFLNQLIPECPTLGDHYVEEFLAIGSCNPAYLMKMAKTNLEKVIELLDAEGVPELVLEGVKEGLGALSAA